MQSHGASRIESFHMSVYTPQLGKVFVNQGDTSMTSKKICVIAGVGPGIGMAIAQRFAAGGMAVVLLARRAEELARYCDLIRAQGGEAHAYPVDLVDTSALQSVLDRIGEDIGAPSVGVYNAGMWRESDPLALPVATFAADLDLCVTGALAMAQRLGARMREAGHGTLLFTGGGLALHPEFGTDVVSLTCGKSALRGLVLALAPAMEALGVHCATVTVAGTVEPGGPFAPELIAEVYWKLYQQERAEWQREIVYSGASN